jgi:hypothetical protein
VSKTEVLRFSSCGLVQFVLIKLQYLNSTSKQLTYLFISIFIFIHPSSDDSGDDSGIEQEQDGQGHQNSGSESEGYIRAPKKSKSSRSSSKNRPSTSKNRSQHRDSERPSVLSEHSQNFRQEKRLNSASTMANTRKELEIKNLKADKKQSAKENDEKEKQIEALKAKISDMGKKRKRGGGDSRSHKVMNDALVLQLKKVTKTELWRTCKFLATDDQKFEACKLVMLHTQYG